MRIAVFFNPRAGPAARPDPERRRAELAGLFEDAGVRAVLHPVERRTLADDVRRELARGADAVVAAGGDGTVSGVAGVLAGTDVPLGVLPLGTLNHFAKDAHIPLQLEQAVRVIAAGNARRVDVAELNGRCFINNSSIGLYPRIVGDRDARREQLGYGKWPAMLAALFAVFRRYPLVGVVLETPEQRVPGTMPFVFVGNNRYAVHGLTLGTRERLDEGVLSVYFTSRTGRFGLLRMAVRALLGRLEQAADFGSLVVPAVRVHTRKRTLEAALDGEVTRLTPPLVYRIRPGALRLLVP
jgi:diacylglycerol kinase family enzyme